MTGLGPRLHPTHLVHEGCAPQAMVWNTAPGSRAERLKHLTEKAGAFAADCAQDIAEQEHSVLRCRTNIVVRTAGAEDVVVPMLHSEVGYAPSDQDSVVALAYPRASTTGDLWVTSGQPKQYNVWLIIVHDGATGLRSFLQVLGAGGAVRGDFEGSYEIPTRPFAAGACACVYKALETPAADHDRQIQAFAAKALRAGSGRELLRAEKEAELLCKAQGHPNVSRVFGVFFSERWGGQDETLSGKSKEQKEEEEDEQRPRPRLILLMELCTRGSLHDRVMQLGAYVENEALQVTSGLLSALEHIHQHGIVHRDVKPENTLRGADGRPILTDFGIAAFMPKSGGLKDRCGTPGYAAPELVTRDSVYGKKVDIFAAGVFLYFCLFGCTPFVTKPKPTPKEVVAATVAGEVNFPVHRAVTEQMRQFVLILLTKDPEDRPSATGALKVLNLFPHSKFPAPAAPQPASAEAEAANPLLKALPDEVKAKKSSGSKDAPSPQALAPLLPLAPPAGQPAAGRPKGRSFFRSSSPGEQSGERQSNGSSKRGLSSLRLWNRAGDKTSSGRHAARGSEEMPSTSADGSPDRFDSVWGSADNSVPSQRNSSHSPGRSPGWFRRTPKVSPAGAPTAERPAPPATPIVDRLCPSFLRRRAAAASGSSGN